MATLLKVKDLKTVFFTKAGLVKAVDGISYDVDEGEVVGIVGESGCGKSVSVMSMLRLIPDPPGRVLGGQVFLEGEDLLQLDSESLRSIRGRKVSMVFQEPMTALNPVFTVGYQIKEVLKEHLKMKDEAATEECARLLGLVGIPEAKTRLNQYPHQFSGGMRQRALIAMALACHPKVLIADEPTTAVDTTTQAQLLELIVGLAQEQGTAVILITHNLGVVARYAQRLNIMYAGRMVEQGTTRGLFANPAHPYTRLLLRSVPRLDRPDERLQPIEGEPPSLVNLGAGCVFCPRCPDRAPRCEEEQPQLLPRDDGGLVACFMYKGG